jgi:hypothetical protein
MLNRHKFRQKFVLIREIRVMPYFRLPMNGLPVGVGAG